METNHKPQTEETLIEENIIESANAKVQLELSRLLAIAGEAIKSAATYSGLELSDNAILEDNTLNYLIEAAAYIRITVERMSGKQLEITDDIEIPNQE